jgi:hypothetical protein
MKNLLLLSVIIICSCHGRFNSKRVRGNGNTKSEVRSTTGFKSIEVQDDIDVTLTQGSDFKVTVFAEPDILPYIFTTTDNHVLTIHVQDGIDIETNDAVKVSVQMPVIEGVAVAGSGSITSTGTIENSDEIKMSISGSGDITMPVKTPSLDVDIAGSGTATISGETRDEKLSIGGAGNCYTEHLKSENAKVNIAGSGNVKLYASKSLDVSIAGSGDVYYAGNPDIQKSILGSGTIEQLK